MKVALKITVETGSWAERYINKRSISIDVPEGSTVLDAINAAGILLDEAGIAVVDGRAVPREYPLSDGDVVKILPVIIGG